MLAPCGFTRCLFILSKNVLSFTVNSVNLARCSIFHIVLPKIGPANHPTNVATNVKMPILMTGSIGINFVTSSAISGLDERKTIPETVAPILDRILLAREKRRRDVLKPKNVFQFMAVFEGG